MRNQSLASLSLCLLSLTAQAQWVNQPISFAADIAPTYLDAIDANTAWTVGVGLSGAYLPSQLARTVNAGQTWTVAALPLQTANLETVTALAAADATTAWMTTVSGNATGGRILRTTDGGQTWATQSNASVYGNANSSPALLRFFSATEGLTVGEPVAAAGSMEMYTTANAGATWTPLTGSPVALPGEIPLNTTPAVVGNLIWFVTNQGRVFRSANKGLTWTVANAVPAVTTSATVAFRDARNGLLSLLNATSTRHQLYRTADGGATWALVPHTGPLRGLTLCPVPGATLYVSAGANVGNGDQGSSYSRDNGQTWVALESTLNHFTAEFLSPTTGWSGGFDIQGGQVVGSANRFAGTLLGTRTDAALQASLSVAPNPASGGRFALQTSGTGGAATVRVLDVTGRLVQQHNWSRAGALALDLSQAPGGLYVVEVQTASGTARQKVVVD